MSDGTRTLRNVAIVLVLAGLVYAVPGGGQASLGLSNLLSVVLFAGIAFFGYRLYMEHRMTIMDLPDDQRLLIYGSATLLLVAFLCTRAMWQGAGPLIIVWFVMIGLAAAGASTVARRRREY